VAKAYGIKSISLEKPEQINEALRSFFEDINEPILLNVMINIYTNAYPKLAFGMPLSRMEPLCD
jgi:acetolactate synthase-1/2/3 large subunit